MGAQLWLSCGPISVSVAHLKRDVVANKFFCVVVSQLFAS
jgi:hypothetical protein